MGFDQMHIRHCILYTVNLKKAQKHPKQQEIFNLSIKTRPRVSKLVNNGSNNLNQETLPLKTPFDQKDQVLSFLRF